MHGAGAAETVAAAELGTGQAKFVAQHPEQGNCWVTVIGVVLSVDLEFDHLSPPVDGGVAAGRLLLRRMLDNVTAARILIAALPHSIGIEL
jgi:hypothetical protein